ncbi:thiosulfate/3-mercaptopyruvate sulfurtransferase [Paenibacillus sp. UNCCL117]|uniref:sulfurtransferase n=1 Tax=unclassified Paenibacillus TaxID=185978 RepID=UPI00088BF166|nr:MULTISPECIES: sulfurtransferase [unclassified Paenibacillus]SDD17176.1 thiosulfate/3-mercaptopyruvate sulfurtransferase [Paenibacillus sp. cl123]SFW34901.1 thiosulfate/3-mercaptopyruvate sulfurtransferase [Paenibacillus sp. UNCCL117]
MSVSHIVSTDWVLKRLETGELVLADVRFSPKDADYGRRAYEQGHIPGAVFVDFKADLTAPAGEHGGRSPLPSPERLSERFGQLGIDRSTTVVIYEDGNGPAAARLWWVLRYLGHDDVHVLDGGYSAWTAAGLLVSDELPAPQPRQFAAEPRPQLLADVREVRTAAERPGTVLVDSRDLNQYLGLEAPFDPVAGHIPGAVHYFWKDALTENGAWKPAQDLQERFRGIADAQEVIVYCGSGISATPNVLALTEAGVKNVKLYAGSWSDWISYPDNPIATGEEGEA